MGRDTLTKMFHEYYYGRSDKYNWNYNKKDDDDLIEKIIDKYTKT